MAERVAERGEQEWYRERRTRVVERGEQEWQREVNKSGRER